MYTQRDDVRDEDARNEPYAPDEVRRDEDGVRDDEERRDDEARLDEAAAEDVDRSDGEPPFGDGGVTDETRAEHEARFTEDADADLDDDAEHRPMRTTADEPQPVDDTPTAVDDTPTAVDDTPTAVDDSPTAVDDTPTAVDDTPTAVDDSPTAVDDTPTAVDDTPTAVDDTPTAMGDTSTDVDDDGRPDADLAESRPDTDVDGSRSDTVAPPFEPVAVTPVEAVAPDGVRDAHDVPDEQSQPQPDAAPVGLWGDGDADGLRARWRDLQLRFIDDPRSVANEAAHLVEEAVTSFTAHLSARREELNRWQGDDGDDTERLRSAVRGYRDFLDKLLNV